MANTQLRYVHAIACTIVLPWTVFPTSAASVDLTVIDEPLVPDHRPALLVQRVRP